MDWPARKQLHVLVLDVHEGIGAALAFGEQPRAPIDVEGAGAAARDDAWRIARLRERAQDLLQDARAACRRCVRDRLRA